MEGEGRCGLHPFPFVKLKKNEFRHLIYKNMCNADNLCHHLHSQSEKIKKKT